MKITKQKCIAAEIVIMEVHEITLQYNKMVIALLAKASDNKITTISGASISDMVLWSAVKMKDRAAIYSLIEKELKKKL